MCVRLDRGVECWVKIHVLRGCPQVLITELLFYTDIVTAHLVIRVVAIAVLVEEIKEAWCAAFAVQMVLD